jgi:signal peptidase I
LYSGQTLAGIVFLALVFGTHVLTRRIEGLASTVLCLVAMLDAFRSAQKLPLRGLRTLGIGVLLRVLLTVVLIFGIRAFLLHPFTVPTNGMAPTLLGNTDPSTGQSRTGDHILVDKATYRLQPPRRGDIVVFRTDNIQDIPAESRGTYYVKRIVGLPGERVSILPPFVYINGQKLTDPPIFETIASGESGYHGYGLAGDLPGGLPEGKSLASESASILLGPDEYFVLGDNSPSSLDSRYWGPVRRDSIIGRVTKIYWPRGRMGLTVAE